MSVSLATSDESDLISVDETLEALDLRPDDLEALVRRGDLEPAGTHSQLFRRAEIEALASNLRQERERLLAALVEDAQDQELGYGGL